MKKLLVALLCAVMLLTCVGAMAEETNLQTFGEFVCLVGEGDEGTELYIEKYNLAEGQTELFIPKKIDGHRVTDIDVSTLPESVKTIYMPLYCGQGGEFSGDRELMIIQYADYDWVMNEEYYSKSLADMGEDDYALLWAHVVTCKNGDIHEKEADDLLAEQLPTELGGHKVHINRLNDGDVIYTSGEWQYKLQSYDSVMRAEIVSATLAEGPTELVIPDQIDGYPVQRVDLAVVPASVQVLYMEDDCWYNYENVERTLTIIRYEDYADVQKNDWQREHVPDMTENDLALVNIQEYSFAAGNYDSNYAHVYAADLPAELLGKKCLNGLDNNCVYYTSGEWTYNLGYDGTYIEIVDVKPTEGQTVLFVPSQLEGLPVQRVSNTIVDKHGINLFVLPYSCWMSGDSQSSYGCLSYYDRAWVDARQDDYYTDRYAWLGEKDLSVEDYNHYAAGESTKDTIEYKEIPQEIAGYKVTVNMYFDGNVTLHKKDDFYYIILPDDTIAITKYDNEMAKSLIIPPRIDGMTVTALMGDASNYVIYNSDLTSLELPSTLKVLGKRSIYAWDLKKLEIPEGVTEIGENAIYAYKVSSIKLPEGVTKLGKNWMYSRAKSVNFPSTLTTLEENAFSYSDNITSIKLPDTVTNVGKAAFSEMYKLQSLSLPDNMVEIPERLAAASERLAKISIPAATEVIGKQAFASCTKLATVTFAKKDAQTKVIGDGAFQSSGLSKIALPESLTTIGKEAFLGCEKLSSVSMHDNITSIGTYAFSGCTKLTKISLSEGLTTISEGTFMGCKKLANVTIPASVTSIEEFAFEGCSSKLTVTTTEGSFAQQWAEENGYKVKIAK